MPILLKDLICEAKTKATHKEETLCENEWVSLKRKTNDLGECVYSHETRCDGQIVAILPYRRVGKDAWEYGIREEIVLCWDEGLTKCALTGGVDKGKEIEEMALQELKEEAGFDCKKEDLKSLGTCRGTKSCDTVYHLFAIDVVDMKQGDISGDGGEFEKKAKFLWTYNMKDIECPILNTMYVRLGLY